jgi:primosomal protein N' (replication factor Y)
MLVSRPVTEVSAENKIEVTAGDELLLGTEAVLHRGVDADVVVFLDFDQELHAPRYRAAEQAMWLLVRAARTIGRRRAEGRLLVQTRSPDHRVLQAAVSADPGRLVEEEQALRAALGFPPAGALAEFGGAGAPAFAASIKAGPDVMVLGPRPDGRYLLRAAGPDQLAAVLAETPRPKERMRVAVDPPRI